MNNQLTLQERKAFEPTARVLAANGVAQSLAFTFERKYLNGISANTKPLALDLTDKSNILPPPPYWIQISQVGKPLENSAEKCFSAIQKILSACFMPHKAQLIFLIHGEGGVYDMYLGIRSYDKNTLDRSFTESLSNFIKGIWPGMKCEEVSGELDVIKHAISDKEKNQYKYDYVNAFTGIPSMESQYSKSIYPATIDTLLAGMHKKNFIYMVIADPLPENDIDSILYQVREFNGQAESLKSFNFSESKSHSISVALSESKTICDGTNESKTQKSKWGMLGSGIALASAVFPPASLVSAVVAAGASELLSDFTPSYTEGTNHSEANTEGRTDTNTDTTGQTISSNIVNKQIEAVSEHLFYHSKRFESGKAMGCWSVGAYILAETQSDIQGGSMQLRSIVSGQESIFEPIRVHQIDDVVGDCLPQTLGSFAVPKICVRNVNDNTSFSHPLGSHFVDLRTVLTTKELSYYINFPLKSIPGISVVDSSPEFSLNEAQTNDSNSIDMGRLLYGGSQTSIEYRLPLDQLSRHTLLSGINGTGKTNTVQSILNGIGTTPFLVIEPAKTEYVDWAIEYNKSHSDRPIRIFIPGCKYYKDKSTQRNINIQSLKINPFEPIWLSEKHDPNVLSHIDRLKSTFASAFPMYDILPVLLEDLIYSMYQTSTTNWIGKDATPILGKTMAPTLTGMARLVDKVIEAHGYEKKIGDNMKACLNTRIASLRRGWKKDLLDTTFSTSWSELFDGPCVVNLSYVGDDVDKSFFMSLLLQFLYEYRTAQSEVGLIDFNSSACRHLTVIEEAHRVMQKCEKFDEPQYKTAMMFSNMLSEIRAYGEGMFLVDQVPTRLIPDAIKNTNTKITHRLVSEDDCKAISESMGLSKEQHPIIPKLLVGQCLVSTALSTDKYWVQVNKVK